MLKITPPHNVLICSELLIGRFERLRRVDGWLWRAKNFSCLHRNVTVLNLTFAVLDGVKVRGAGEGAVAASSGCFGGLFARG